MSYLAKQKLLYYKKYKIDIWSFLKNTLQVLHDNTFYKLHAASKDLIKVRSQYKLLRDLYHKRRADDSKARFLYEAGKININILKKKKKSYVLTHNLKHSILSKLICHSILFKHFITLTISKKLSKIFKVIIPKVLEKKKVYYRKPFIYETRVPVVGQKKRRIKDQFVSFKFVKLFYVIYTYRQIKKIAWKAKHQRGVFEHNYLLIIESKLPSYLYRTSFFPTLFESLDFVKGGNVWVNKKFKPLIYYTVKLFDTVGFRVVYKSYILWSFFKRLRRKAFIFIFSRCMYVSFYFLFTILIARFTSKDMINTFSFDYYRIATYAQ